MAVYVLGNFKKIDSVYYWEFYLVDMMPALHNYITVDTQAFLSNAENITIIFNMCKQVSIACRNVLNMLITMFDVEYIM